MRVSFSRRVLMYLVLALAVPQFVSAATVNVGMNDSAFTPQTANVTQGDAVKWTNGGSMMHAVTADNGDFDSPNLNANDTFQHTFNTPGTYRYYCPYHGGPAGYGMSGTVVVSASASAATQNVSLTQTQAQTTQTTQSTQVVQTAQTTQQSSADATIAALRAQIDQLLVQIAALTQQTGGAVAAPIVPALPIPAGGVQCPHISRSLKLGSEGDDVARLQRFLALDRTIYPEALFTGYYGSLTEAAVKRFQCKNRLVCEGTPESTGYGVTGPRTAALLALQCPDIVAGGGNAGGFLKVTPISGIAPLPVTIEVITNASKSCAAATYEVDYGDGTPRTQIAVPANHCNELRQVVTHTYTAPGAYAVTLRSGIFQVSSTVVVNAPLSQTQSTTTIDTLSVTPLTGNAPLTVTYKGTINASGSCSPSTYTLDFGDDTSTQLSPTGCAITTFTVTHVYPAAGNFVVRLTRNTGSVEIGSTIIAVRGGTGTATSTNQTDTLTANPTSGTAPLGVSFSGIINVAAACNAGPYTLVFGDGQSIEVPVSGCYPTSFSIAHTYSTEGTKVVRLQKGSPAVDVTTVSITISAPQGGGGSGGGGQSQDSLEATPTSGDLPLSVSFNAIVNAAGSCTSGAYALVFGDGQSVSLPVNGCSAVSYTVTHSYNTPGTFAAKLQKGSPATDVDSVTITVTGEAPTDSLTADPTSGTVPATITFNAVVNAAGACNTGSYTLVFGDGQTVSLPVSGCNSVSYSISHTYNTAGSFTVKLQKGSPVLDVRTVTVSITSNAGTGQASYFNVSPGAGNSIYGVTAQFEIESACAAYQLNWGDASALVSQSQGTCSLGTVTKQFTHTYQSGGSYTITLKRGPALGTVHTVGISISN